MLGGIFQGVDFNITGDRVSLRLSFDRLNRKSAPCGTKSLRHCQLFYEFSVPKFHHNVHSSIDGRMLCWEGKGRGGEQSLKPLCLPCPILEQSRKGGHKDQLRYGVEVEVEERRLTFCCIGSPSYLRRPLYLLFLPLPAAKKPYLHMPAHFPLCGQKKKT